MELDKLIKSSVENLILILSESEGIPDTMCDVHLVTNPTPLEANDHFKIAINSNDDYSSSDDASLYNANIEYVEASPHDSELVILEVAEIVIPEDEEIEDDNLRKKLLKVNLLIDKIEALKDNSTPSFEFLTKSSSTFPKSVLEETNTFDDSLPEFENFCFDLEEISSEKGIEEEQTANARYWKILACCDDDDDYDSAITPILSTEEPIDSLSIGDEHLDTIPAMESDEVIKSSVENLVPIPSEFEGIPDTMCDVHLNNNPTPLEVKYHLEIVLNSNDDISSSDDDSLHEENIEYVEASPHDSELVSLEAAKIVIPKVEEIEDDNLREKLLNVHILIANIEALKDNPTQSS
nr:hypothetical protein [Tanacetum cinerariifolium]